MAFDCCNLKVIHWLFAYVSDNLSIHAPNTFQKMKHFLLTFFGINNKHFCHKNAIFIAALKVLCKVSIFAMNVNDWGSV